MILSQDRRSTFTLTNDEGKRSTVIIEARYVPVPVKLEPRESINSLFRGLKNIDIL